MIIGSVFGSKIYRSTSFIAILIAASFSLSAQALNNQKDYYKKHMLSLQRSIEKNFFDSTAGFYKEDVIVEKSKNTYSYLWPLCGMLQANNEIEKTTRQKGLFENTLKTIEYYYDASPPAAGYASYIMKYKGGDRFYDDNQWIGIASMDAYNRLKKKEYLKVAKEIYTYMMTGYDTVLSGGIYWQENKKISKNTCSNGPGIILALQLYKATKAKSYLDTALLLYNWVNSKLKAPSGLYYDNISVNNNRVNTRRFSYNTGTMLQSNIYLYEATKDAKYLNEAIAIADSSSNFFYSKGEFKDDYWFNAVMLRAYQHLLQYNTNMKYIKAFKTCLDNTLSNNMNELGLAGKNRPLNLVQQSGLLEILARFAHMENKYQF